MEPFYVAVHRPPDWTDELSVARRCELSSQPATRSTALVSSATAPSVRCSERADQRSGNSAAAITAD